jgi:hypothetical protein
MAAVVVSRGFRGVALRILGGREALAATHEVAARLLRTPVPWPLAVDVEQGLRAGAAWLWLRTWGHDDAAQALVLELFPGAEVVP